MREKELEVTGGSKAQGPDIGGPEVEQFERMNNNLTRNREFFGSRKNPEEETEKEKRRRAKEYVLRTPRDLKETRNDGTYDGMTAAQMITTQQGADWMEKRKKNMFKSNRQHLEFAKGLFLSWNDDGSGIVHAEDVIKPLTALGVASNSKLVESLVQQLGGAQGKGRPIEDIQIDMLNFIKMFRTDSVSKTIAEVIQ